MMIKDIVFVLIVLSITAYAHTKKCELIDIYEKEVIKAETALIK